MLEQGITSIYLVFFDLPYNLTVSRDLSEQLCYGKRRQSHASEPEASTLTSPTNPARRHTPTSNNSTTSKINNDYTFEHKTTTAKTTQSLEPTMTLSQEIKAGRQKVKTDDTKMTLGEIMNLYKDGDLIINPEFQRAFRWTSEQKTRFIESILLGIPIPSIFVAADNEGRWELVDGLQRVSTILQFFGLLQDATKPQLVLEKTDRLKNLEGVAANEGVEGASAILEPEYVRDIKRTPLEVQIIQRESDPKAKFDLFERINSYGSSLTYQEMLNAALYSINPSFCHWLRNLTAFEAFNKVTTFSEKERIEAYNEEIVLRFLMISTMPLSKIQSIQNYRTELKDFALQLADPDHAKELTNYETLFKNAFEMMSAISSDILHKWIPESEKYNSKFSRTAFDAVACAFGYAIHNGRSIVDNPLKATQDLWEEPNSISTHSTGIQTATRIQKVVPRGISALTK